VDHSGGAGWIRDPPRYAEMRAWLERLVAASPILTLETFGRTGEGREMLLVRASNEPRADGSPKPIVLVQAGIHAGEIDGEDAGSMLLRDIAVRGKGTLLDTVDLVFVPIYNIDGHERMSRWRLTVRARRALSRTPATSI
jgi:murein tripeptide amidase MpaA